MSDEKQIRDSLQIYFECMHESSADKTHAAFHPNAKITGYLKDKLLELSVEEFANFVAGQQPSPEEKGETTQVGILSIEIAGNTAIAKVRDNYIGSTFLDTLSYLKIDGKWAIYNKLFHAEG